MHHPSVIVPFSVSAALALSMAAHGGVVFTGTQLRVQASVPAASPTVNESVASGVEESLFADVSIQTWLHEGQFPNDHWYLPGAYTSGGAHAQNILGQAGLVVMGDFIEYMQGANRLTVTCDFVVEDETRGYAASIDIFRPTSSGYSSGFLRLTRDGTQTVLEQTIQAVDSPVRYEWSTLGELPPGAYTLEFDVSRWFSDSPLSWNETTVRMEFSMPTPGAAALLLAAAGVARRRRR